MLQFLSENQELILAAVVAICSEVLPFIKSTKANSIVQLVVLIAGHVRKHKSTEKQ